MEMYWSTDEMLAMPFFGKCMSQNCFSSILRFLHFTSNETGNEINKIRPAYDHLISKFRETFYPGSRVTVGESLMLWQGRLGWKQFIRTKWARFDIKTFDLCECSSGYVYSSTVYTGKGMDNTGKTEVGLSGPIVMHLIDPLLDEGRTVYLDNWYSSPRLYTELHKRCTNACETVW
jgi:hypothetical protein